MEGEQTPGIDAETRLRLYLLILNRYENLIREKESKTISEIRQLVSPYKSEFVKQMKEEFVPDNYDYDKDFFTAVEKVIEYMKKIKTCEFSIPFWMSFEEINELKITDSANKAILFAALLRSLGSENVKVLVTKSRKQYVRFEWGGDRYLFVPESGSLLRNDDVTKVFESDPPAYAFNDLAYENYEEE
jgi:hypothetical protein